LIGAGGEKNMPGWEARCPMSLGPVEKTGRGIGPRRVDEGREWQVVSKETADEP